MIDKVKIQILNMLATKFTKEQAKNFVANEIAKDLFGAIPDYSTRQSYHILPVNTTTVSVFSICFFKDNIIFLKNRYGKLVWPGNEYNGAFSTSGDKFEFYYTSDIVIKPRYVGPASADIIWRLRGVGVLSYVYDKRAQTWTTYFPYGYVSGVAKCTSVVPGNTTPGSNTGLIADYDTIENASAGRYCYCKMTEPLVAASPWVYRWDLSTADNCKSWCAYYCGKALQDSRAFFRASVFSAAGD